MHMTLLFLSNFLCNQNTTSVFKKKIVFHYGLFFIPYICILGLLQKTPINICIKKKMGRLLSSLQAPGYSNSHLLLSGLSLPATLKKTPLQLNDNIRCFRDCS